MLAAILTVTMTSACATEAKVAGTNVGPPDRIEDLSQKCEDWDEWQKPAPVFQVYGDTFYVGSCGIAALVVLTDEKAVLLDTAEAGFGPTLADNIRKIGGAPDQIGWVLGSHEHFDHLGGLAAFQKLSGATVIAAKAAVPALSGEIDPNDPQAGLHEPLAAVTIGQTVKNGDVLTLGGKTFTAFETPGHTPGALTWQWEACEGDVCKTIVYADSLSAISSDDYKFSDHPEYVAAFRAGIERLRALKCDILLTPHPSASDMIERAKTGTFEGGMTCIEYADMKSEALDERLAKEAAAK